MVGWPIPDVCQLPQSEHVCIEEAEQSNFYILHIPYGQETDMTNNFDVS